MRTKWNLTRSEQRFHSVNSARLKAAGVATGVENIAPSEEALRIDQNGDGVVCAGTCACIVLAAWVRLTVLSPEIIIRNSDITLVGCEDATMFFSQPHERSSCYKEFGWLNLKSDTVLNHRIFNERPLPRGIDLEGFVVAQSFRPLASEFQTGMNICAKLCLSDQADSIYTAALELRVERCSQERIFVRKGTGLYDQVIVPTPGRKGPGRRQLV
jgi:hypothetical protein